MIHLKRADRRLLLDWQTFMSGKKIVAEITAKYYVPDQKRIDDFALAASKWPLREGWQEIYNDEFFAQFFSFVSLDYADMMYRGKHFGSGKLFSLPDEFNGEL